MRIPYSLKRLVRRIRTEGVAHTAGLIVSLVLEPYYEWRLGIRAFGPGKGKSFSIPTDHRSFKIIMQHLKVRPRQDTFVDYGCGRGRVLAMASAYPFRRIIGIEYQEELSSNARENVKRINRRLMQCDDISVITGDAGAFEVPADVTVAYFFDPFGEDVFRRVVEQIHRSVCATPRKLTIIYYGPAWESTLASCDWLVKTREFKFPRSRCCIYETRGA